MASGGAPGAGGEQTAPRHGPSHGYFCEGAADCPEPPVECVYPPSFAADGTPVDEVAWLCPACLAHAGFCQGCRTFWGGVETFEFGRHPGYCENCASEIDAETADEFGSDDDEDYP